jgi:hypothetical protein
LIDLIETPGAQQRQLQTGRSLSLHLDTHQERSDANFQLPPSNFFNRIGDSFDLAQGL